MNLIQRCDHLADEIERFVEERRHVTRDSAGRGSRDERRLERQAHSDETRAMWSATFSSEALALLRSLREAGVEEHDLSEPGSDADAESAERWQAASEARDFSRTGSVDEIGMAHLARYFRLAADRLREHS